MDYKNIIDLIDISLSDVKASTLLFEKKFHSQSYYFFQQASEKANKAFGLFLGVVENKDLAGKIGHNPLMVHKIALEAEVKEMKEALVKLEKFPEINNHKIINRPQIENHVQNLESGIKFHATTHKKDFIVFDKKLIDEVLDQLEYLLDFCKIKPTKHDEGLVLIHLESVKEFMSNILPENEILEFDNLINGENRDIFLKQVFLGLELYFKITFISHTFYFSALITNGHVNSSRYLIGATNPLTLYTKKNPCVKKQGYFLWYLEKALKLLKSHIHHKMKAELESKIRLNSDLK